MNQQKINNKREYHETNSETIVETIITDLLCRDDDKKKKTRFEMKYRLSTALALEYIDVNTVQ